MSLGDRRDRYTGAGIFTLALVARLLFTALVAGYGSPPHDDAWQYDSIARSLSKGGEFVVGDQALRAHRAPAYPFFLAAIYRLFGPRWAAGQVAQAFLGAVTCVIVYAIGVSAFERRVAVAAGLASALDPYSIYWSGFLLSEPLCTMFTTASTWALLRARDAMRWAGGWAVLCGLATLTRPNMAILLPLGMVCFPGAFKRRVSRWVLTALVFALTLAPWTLRNYLVLHRWVPVTTMGGTVLWESNNPYVLADPGLEGHALHAADLPEAAGAKGLSETEFDAYNFRLAVGYLRANPGAIPGLVGVKFLRVWNFFPQFESPAFRRIATGVMVVLVAALLLGLKRAWSLRDARVLPLLVPLAAVTLTAVIYWGDARIRAPAQPAALILAAYALVPPRGRADGV